jgi:amino-acid N-acetyltransferase
MAETPTIDPLVPDAGVVALLAACGLNGVDLAEAPTTHLVGTRQGGAIAAVIAVEPYGTAGLLRSLAVAPDKRGHGLGRKLVAAAEEWAADEGVTILYLLTETAASFFPNLGYAVVEREAAPQRLQAASQFAHRCSASATCLCKSLQRQDEVAR